MAIEYKKPITFTKDSTLYGHNSLDEGGFPSNAGHGKVEQILNLSQEQVLTYIKQNVSIAVDSTNNLKYNFVLDGQTVASFEIPPDKFLESATYNSDTNKLIFVFNAGSNGTNTVDIDLNDLVDAYTAGLGLQISGNEFSVKIKNTETRLKADATGMYIDLTDITNAISAETQRAQNAETELSGRIDNVNATLTSIQENIDNAALSAQQAAQSATAAQGFKETASQMATEAGNSANRAATSESNAQGYMKTASDKAAEADGNAKLSERYAKGTEDGTAVSSGAGYQDNAKYYKELAETAKNSAALSAQNASASATSAGISETNAASSASLASTSAGSASASASAASSSASSASQSKTAAETAANNASNSASAALSAKTAAEEKATEANASATEANQAKLDAETAKTGAESAKTAAEQAQSEIETMVNAIAMADSSYEAL